MDGFTEQPIGAFLEELRVRNFQVSFREITDCYKVIAAHAMSGDDHSELCLKLAPLFASSREQQEDFISIFNKHFSESALEPTVKPHTSLYARQYRRKWFRWMLYCIAATLVSVLSILTIRYINSDALPSTVPEYELTDARRFQQTPFKVKAGQSLEILLKEKTGDSSKFKEFSIVPYFSWGDYSAINHVALHRYEVSGRYPVNVCLFVYYRNKFRYSTHLVASALVCDSTHNLKFVSPAPGDSIRVNSPVRIEAAVSGKSPLRVFWDSLPVIPSPGYRKDTSFAYEGNVRIKWTAVFDSLKSPCSCSDSLDVKVYNPDPPLQFHVRQGENATPVRAEYRIRTPWILMVLVLIMVSMLMAIVFEMMSNNIADEEKRNDDQLSLLLDEMVQSFSGKNRPLEVQFIPKDQFLIPEAGLKRLARQMRQRWDNDKMLLNIPDTIHQTIRNYGLFSPTYSAGNQQIEFLILEEEGMKNNQQSKLFDYLLDMLAHQNVLIDRFRYRKVPLICYNSQHPEGIPIQKVFQLYSRHVLLLFSNGYNLLNPFVPEPKENLLKAINLWKNKAIVTPVPFSMWGAREFDALERYLPIYPADVSGLLLLVKHMLQPHEEGADEIKRIQHQRTDSKEYDFEDAGELEEYCNCVPWSRITRNGIPENVLFQWIAALAVFPKIRWELIIGIGKRILQRYGLQQHLHYSTLLFISRITWIRNGQFPDRTQFELLKKLALENEVIARETVLEMLDEIPDNELNKNHYAWEERELQRITNEFLLFSWDHDKYKNFQNAGFLYQKLSERARITKSPIRKYLENQTSEWETLISGNQQKTTQTSRPSHNRVPPDPANRKTRRAKLKSVYLVLAVVCFCLFYLSTIIFPISMMFKFTNSGNSVLLQLLDQNKIIYFNYQNITSRFANSHLILKFANNPPTDVLQGTPTEIKYLVDGKPVKMTLSLENFRLDTVMQVEYDNYAVVVTDHIPVYATEVVLAGSGTCGEQRKNIRSWFPMLNNKKMVFRDSIVSHSTGIEQGVCFNRIGYGKAVDPAYIRQVIRTLAEKGVPLTEDHLLNNLRPNSIVIYYASKDQVALPASLEEIWSDDKNDIRLNINLTKRLLYFSNHTGNAYQTLPIVDVSLISSGYYKMIAGNESKYDVFFVDKNSVSIGGFLFSFCEGFTNPADAKKVLQNRCGKLFWMRWYYETDKNRVYFPVDASLPRIINISEIDKLVGFLKSLPDSTGVMITLNTNPEFISIVPSQKNVMHQPGISKFKVSFIQQIMSQDGQVSGPFSRCYLRLTTISDHPVNLRKTKL